MAPVLSLVVPAYNERRRLPTFLADVRVYCDTTFGESYEVIVVNDGSRDGTKEFLDETANDWGLLRGIHHVRNLGKGAALRSGFQAARGDYWLLADADGATPMYEERRLRQAIVSGAEIAIGSRAALQDAGKYNRRLVRKMLSMVFSRAARLFFNLTIHDSQCGFKMFPRDVGERLIIRTREHGYLFDLELLLLAEQFGYRVVEIPVLWHEVSGSKVRICSDSLKMLWGLVRLRTGLWSARALAGTRPVIGRESVAVQSLDANSVGIS